MSDQQQSSEEQNIESQQSSGSHYSLRGRYYVKKNERGQIVVLTDGVADALDRCKVSYRNSVHIIGSVANALGHDIKDLVLNKSSFNEARKRLREQKANNLKILLKNQDIQYIVVHWDGKIIPDDILCKKIDRVPIVISSRDIEKIIDVPALENGKGVTQAQAIYRALTDWGLHTFVEAVCCDTTNANLGHKAGAAVILEQMLNKNLLYLPCRHHIFELILAAIFSLKFPGSTGPDVPIFKAFKEFWPRIDKNKYKSGKSKIHLHLRHRIGEIVIFIKDNLQNALPRDDYKELLELSLIFLGEGSEIKFRKPGAYHHARWMAKAIYTIKMYLVEEQFPIESSKKESLFDICQFIVFVYLEAWYNATLAIKAPNLDLQLMKKMYDYKNIDEQISTAALKKFQNHLWYLSSECSALSFFDKNISLDIKRQMVKALDNIVDVEFDPPNRFYVNSMSQIEALLDKEMNYFINSNSLKLFDRFNLSREFLSCDPATWPINEKYLESRNLFKTLKVVNDSAERAVKLTQDYINILTRDEDQKQYLISVVEEHRKNFPNANKQTIWKKLKNNN